MFSIHHLDPNYPEPCPENLIADHIQSRTNALLFTHAYATRYQVAKYHDWSLMIVERVSTTETRKYLYDPLKILC